MCSYGVVYITPNCTLASKHFKTVSSAYRIHGETSTNKNGVSIIYEQQKKISLH